MKKLLAFMVMVVMTISAIAQTEVLSVCGITMGTSKDVALSILRDRFGYAAVREDAGDLKVYDGTVGGIPYKFMTFYFAWINGESIFNGASFSTPYELSEKKDAIKQREYIKSIYEQKYDISEFVNDDGLKYYGFGNNNIYFGFIAIDKGKSNDGITRLHLKVVYFGPYDESDDI